MRWDSESQLIIWSCYYGSHLRLQIHSRPILCGILNQCWSWPCQILSHDICRSSFQLDIWIFLWCLDISLHPDVRDNLHTKTFGFTTGNRQLQLDFIDWSLTISKVYVWSEKCWDDLKNARMIWKVSGWSGKCSDDLLNVLFLTLVSSLEVGATPISGGILYYDFVQIGRGWCLGLVHSLAGLLFQPRFKHHLTVNVRVYISYFYVLFMF